MTPDGCLSLFFGNYVVILDWAIYMVTALIIATIYKAQSNEITIHCQLLSEHNNRRQKLNYAMILCVLLLYKDYQNSVIIWSNVVGIRA